MLIAILAVLPARPSLAQVQPDVRDRVVPAVVLIAIVANVTENGTMEPRILPMGSGTIVSSNGLILTNRHVVNMAEHRRMLKGWEAQASAEGHPVTIELLDQSVLIFTSDGMTAPVPRYVATIAASDESLDLAILQIVAIGSEFIDPSALNVPFVPLGDSDAVGLGDPIDIFGYPGMSGGALIYTQGVVSGFQAQPGVSARAWIITDATMSGGSSGGTAINRQGELIGVPTWGTALECRPADMNHDGRIDAADVGCLPIGGSLGNIRPSSFARDLLARASEASPNHAPGNVPAPAALPQPSPPQIAGPLPAVAALLPVALPLEHGVCFRVEDDGLLTFDELTDRLGGSVDAAARLHGWGWQASAFRTFACDTPPDGEAGWIDVSVHLFADAASAQQALDYFAASRASSAMLLAGASPAIGDHSAVLSGPTTNGKEFTIYVSQGPLLVRVTGVSPTGIPFSDVLTVAEAILQTPLPEAPTDQPQNSEQSSETVAAYLPVSLTLAHAACFRTDEIVILDFPALVDRFSGVPDAATRLQDLGWQAGASRQFSCDGPPVGHVGWIDMSVHRFQDAASAAAAVPFFASSRALGTNLESAAAPTIGDSTTALAGPATNGTEYTLYLSTGPHLFRVTGVAPDGDPASDVQQVMMGLLAGSLIVDQRASPPVVAPTPSPPTVIPTPMVPPTAVTIPTATPVPTATPSPSPTPLPQPTATSTPIPSPTATAIPIPTSLPTSTAVPMPTPRAIAVPTVTPDRAAGPTAEAEQLVDRLLSAEFPDTLLAYGSAREPTLDEDSAPGEGFFGAVEIFTGGAMDGGRSGIRYAVFAGTEEAEWAYGRWRRDRESFADEVLDVSGPALGPHAVVLFFGANDPFGGCGAQVGNVLVTVSVVEGPADSHKYLYDRVLGNCVGAVAHLRSVLAQTP